MRDLFRQAQLPTPELDARLLAEGAFAMRRLELINREREPVPQDGLDRLRSFGERRLRGEPVARILGEKEFWGLDFSLNAATLVPRPETELLVERGRSLVSDLEVVSILDLGTGTGCIPIALLYELPQAQALAIDISEQALEAARANAARHGVAERFRTRHGSWFSPLAPGEKFDLIISNPPYIETEVIGTLSTEVREFDPARALDGGADGLAAYREIAAEAARFLKPTGVLLLEIGSGQGAAVTQILRARGYDNIAVEVDLSGHQRMVVAFPDALE